MKKHTFIATLLIGLFSATTFAQKSHEKGQKDINLGIGFGDAFVATGYTSLPLFSGSFDYGITDDISIGGLLGYTGSSYTYNYFDWNHGNGNGYTTYSVTDKWTYFIVCARGAYHFGRFIPVPKLDVYAGLMLGNDFAHYSYTTTDPNPGVTFSSASTQGGFVFAPFGGARYRFTDNFGVYGELGYGLAALSIGVNFKF